MKNIKVNINNTQSIFIEFPIEVLYNASQDQPYYANINSRDSIFEISFEYMFNHEIKYLQQSNECELRYGKISGKVYSFIIKDNLHNITKQNIKHIFNKINMDPSKEVRFISNIKNTKLIIEFIINNLLLSQ